MTAFRVDRSCGSSLDREQRVANRVQMIVDDTMLRDDVRLEWIALDAEVAEHRTGVDPLIDLQQRHADVAEIAGGARPEAAGRVAILGQIPGCITNVPSAGIENTDSLSRVLHRASTRSGWCSRTNASASGELGDETMISGGVGPFGKRVRNRRSSCASHARSSAAIAIR